MNIKSAIPSDYQVTPQVARALRLGLPVVALESTVITHGLPYPENKQLALDMEEEIRQENCTPATIAVLDGGVHVGIQTEQLEDLAKGGDVHKISSRDFGPAIAKRWRGGTTVAATSMAAHQVGIKVFATGGIGGVHRQLSPSVFDMDISADLPQLAKTPLIVVCAGAKAILDLPATLEYLETFAVPVVGYRTDEFPAFYSRSSGLPVSVRAETPEEIAAIARAHWRMELNSAVLVANPPPEEAALPAVQVSEEIEQALKEAAEKDIRGQAVTPFLLGRVSQLTGGASLRANLALLRSNARLAAQIAIRLAEAEGAMQKA